MTILIRMGTKHAIVIILQQKSIHIRFYGYENILQTI